MRFLFIIFRQYPWQTVTMLMLLVLSGIAEGVGLSAMLPLLAIALGGVKGTLGATAKQVTPAEKMIRDIFDTIGLTPTLEFLLILILAAMLLKCVLVWLANRRVGYTVAHLTTKLRLQVLRAFILARWEFHLNQPMPSVIASTRAALQILSTRSELRRRLWDNAHNLYHRLQELGFQLGPEPSPVVAVRVANIDQAIALLEGTP